MKKYLSFVLLLLFSTNSFSQKNEPVPVLSKQDYLKKSKKQKTAAWIFLGGGATFVLTGIIIPKGDLVHVGFLGNDYENDGIKSTFGVTGFLCTVGSIPFFVASGKNKKKAMSLSFKNERIQQLYKNSFVYKQTPALILTVPL